jgi:hypothetical protein
LISVDFVDGVTNTVKGQNGWHLAEDEADFGHAFVVEIFPHKGEVEIVGDGCGLDVGIAVYCSKAGQRHVCIGVKCDVLDLQGKIINDLPNIPAVFLHIPQLLQLCNDSKILLNLC